MSEDPSVVDRSDPDAESGDRAARDSTGRSAGSGGATDDGAGGGDDGSAARVAVLEAENRRLRERYRETKRTTYRRTALALVAVGALCVGAAALLPSVRRVLLVLGGVGVFGGLLTWYLTPERVLAATVTDAVYGAHADAVDGLLGDLGLRDERVYVPTEASGVRLFVPLHADFSVPERADRVLSVERDEERGVLLPTAGDRLAAEFDAGREGEDLRTALPTLVDGLVEQWELARAAESEVAPADGRATVTFEDPTPPDPERVDHPAVSFLACGLVRTLGEPVSVGSVGVDDRVRVVLEWDGGD